MNILANGGTLSGLELRVLYMKSKLIYNTSRFT